MNLEILMDLRQRKENSDNGGGESGEIVKAEKIVSVQMERQVSNQ